jgi:hypothetical protein
VKVRKLHPKPHEAGVTGEVIDYTYDRDYMVLFDVIWYGKPGTEEVRADMLEVIR